LLWSDDVLVIAVVAGNIIVLVAVALFFNVGHSHPNATRVVLVEFFGLGSALPESSATSSLGRHEMTGT
jgi:hypothetical protein